MSNRNEQTYSDQPDRTYVERREEKSGGNVGLSLIVGGLVVAVGVLVWALSDGGYVAESPVGDDVDVSVEGVADSASDAADSAETAAEGTAAAVEDAGDSVENAAEDTAEAASDQTGN